MKEKLSNYLLVEVLQAMLAVCRGIKMRDIIISSLRSLGIDRYLITECEKNCKEMFFIKKTLDMTRTEALDEWNVTVYHDDEDKKMRGCAACMIHQGMEEDEIRRTLKDAYYAAGYAMNPYYTLVSGSSEPIVKAAGSLAQVSLENAAHSMAEALFAADTGDKSFINSAELFVEKKTVRIINSEGVDCGYENYSVKGEFVVQCLEPVDVELYQDFSYDELDTDSLKKLVADKLNTVVDRARADRAPEAGRYNVLLSEDSVREVLSFYSTRANVANIYSKYSTYEVGMQVQGENVAGERLNITLRSSVPYSNDGIKMHDCELIKDGVLKNVHGGLRMSQYLKVQPTGEYNKLLVDNGSESIADMKKGRVLHVVSFSDFNMNAMTGHFAGEIRLAYLYDNGSVSLVTGGSVNGSIIDAQHDLVFSEERYDSSAYSGPYAVLLKDVPVSGTV